MNGALFSSLDARTRQAVLQVIVAVIDASYLVVVVAAGGLTVLLSLAMKRGRLFGMGMPNA